MEPLVSPEITRKRIAQWMMETKPVDVNPTWIERRQAIVFQGHTYLIVNGQVFQCAHCGHYDPQWSATEVLRWFETNFGIKPVEIEVVCSVAVNNESD